MIDWYARRSVQRGVKMEKQQEKRILAVDIGGTAVKIGLADREGKFLRTAEYAVDFDGYETPILNTVLKSCRAFLCEADVDARRLWGIGVSATGSINTRKGTVDGGGSHIRNWIGSRIREEMEALFHVPVYVLNDANAAVLGEMWLGAAVGRREVVMLTVGTGIGGGIIADGRLLLGASGFAGEIGKMILGGQGNFRTGGDTGYLEEYASMAALVRTVRRAADAGEFGPGVFPAGEINGRRIFDEIGRGNVRLEQIADGWMDCIADGIVSLVHIFNPETIIIGGGVSSQKELFIDRVRRKALERMRPEFAGNVEIVAARLANNAGMAGAVYYCMQRLEEA